MSDEAIPRASAGASEPDFGYERELVAGAKRRSEEAWTEIYERHYARLFRYVQARVSDRQTAEDLTATVFVEAVRGISSYSSHGRPLLAWLYAIARNVVNYHHRSRLRKGGFFSRAFGQSDDAVPEDPGGDAGDPAAALDLWDLRDAVSSLSDDQQEVTILRYFVGLSTPEVAQLLGKRERAIYSLQTRAIKALRRRLGSGTPE